MMMYKKSSVLLVEDDPRVLRLEQMVLEKEGFSVVGAGSGEEALELLAEITPSLIVLDVGLPGIDGFTACSRIREFSQVSIIMVTGKDFNEDKVRGLDLGADDYITKPFSPNELAARVKAALRRSVMSNEVAEPTVQDYQRRSYLRQHLQSFFKDHPLQPQSRCIILDQEDAFPIFCSPGISSMGFSRRVQPHLLFVGSTYHIHLSTQLVP